MLLFHTSHIITVRSAFSSKIRHFFGPSLTRSSGGREVAYLAFSFLLVLKLAWILILMDTQTGYHHMYSLKGHHLLVHTHSKVLLKTHLSVKYKEKSHLFQTLTACCPP